MTTTQSHTSARWMAGVISLGLAAVALGQDKPAPEAAAPAPAPAMSDADIKTNSSYALGSRTGSDFARQFGRFGVKMEDLDREAFMKGFTDAFKGGDYAIPQETLQAAMEAFGNQVQKREGELADKNKAEGQKFLAENGKREGVVTTDSGLQYEVLVKGGDQIYVEPKGEDAPQKLFQVHYKGTLIDGTQFDASPEGETVPMTLQVVPGFREALTTMPVGAKWKLYLSPDLAYGEQRASAEIGPNSTLIFELELKAIEDAPAPQGFPFPMPQGR